MYTLMLELLIVLGLVLVLVDVLRILVVAIMLLAGTPATPLW